MRFWLVSILFLSLLFYPQRSQGQNHDEYSRSLHETNLDVDISETESDLLARIENAIQRNLFPSTMHHSCWDDSRKHRNSFIQFGNTFDGAGEEKEKVKKLHARLNEDPVLTVVTALPTKDEIQWRLDLPTTMSLANSEFQFATVGGVPGRRHWSKTSGLFPKNHPRSNRSFCIEMASVVSNRATAFYEAYKKQIEPSYMLSLSNVMINKAGVVYSPCGVVQLMESCDLSMRQKGNNLKIQTERVLSSYGLKLDDFFSSFSQKKQNLVEHALVDLATAGGGEKIQIIDEVYVMPSAWDHNYYHVLHEVLFKVSRFLDFLKFNPNIKIQLIEHEKYVKYKHFSGPLTNKMYADLKKFQIGPLIRRGLFRLLGIDYEARVFSGPALARRAYVPNEIMCGFPMHAAIELHRLASVLRERAFEWINSRNIQCPSKVVRKGSSSSSSSSSSTSTTKSIIIQGRICPKDALSSKFDGKCSSYRYWTEQEFKRIIELISIQFPNHDIIAIESDSKPTNVKSMLNASEMYINVKTPTEEEVVSYTSNLACDIKHYSSSEIIVGIHGAGLANAMFLQPGGLVVEITGEWDGRVMPLCGHYGPLASATGCHHFTFSFDGPASERSASLGLDIDKLISQISDFYRNTRV